MTRPVTNERLQVLWLAAVEGLHATRDDILDLIDEIKFLRMTLDMAYPELPDRPEVPVVLQSELMPDPWSEEFPGN